MNRFTKLIGSVCLTMLFTTTVLKAGEIHDAAAAGDLNKVRALIEADSILLNSKDDGGNTPLHRACISKQRMVAMYLIEKGANINARNKIGFTPLMVVINAHGNDIDLIQHFINKGADINAQLERGLSTLHYTVFSGNLEAVRLFINHGADLNCYDKICYGTVLHSAINQGQNEAIAKLLIESGSKLKNYSFGNTELHLAVMKGYANVVLALIQHGADIHAVNEYNHTALYYAAKHGYQRIADILISAGAKQNEIAETNFGYAPQLNAALKEDEAYFWYLGGYYGGGYAVKTKDHLIIFDKTEINESKDACLANGNLNPRELEGQNITVLATKTIGAKFEKEALELIKKMPNINFIIDDKPILSDTANKYFPSYRKALPHESFSVDGVIIHTIPAVGRGYGGAVGVGFLIEVDGVKIFHSGFHASRNDSLQMIQYRREIDFLKTFGLIDIAILSVRGHLTASYVPYLYLIDQLSPQAIYLMGGDVVTNEYPKCVEALKVRNTPVKYPEGGRAMGERFHYIRDSILK